MSNAQEWIGLRILIACTVFGTLAASSASASSMSANITYHTSGSIGSDSMTGNQVVSFRGIEGGSLTTPTPFQRGSFAYPVPDGYGTRVAVGEFVVTPPAPLMTTTYENTPFSITFHVDSVDGHAPGPETKEAVLTGVLNGMVSGSGPANLTATFSAMFDPGPPFFPEFSAGSFSTGELAHVLTMPDYLISLAPSTMRDGRTSVSVLLISALPVPEPAALAVFLAATAGLICWCRIRSAN